MNLLRLSFIMYFFAFTLGLSGISLAQGNLISNGSFEVGTCSGGFQTIDAIDTTAIPDWEVVVDSVDLICGNPIFQILWESFDGLRDVDLDGRVNAFGAIQQTFPTEIGKTYEVTFYMGANNNNPPPLIKSMRVSAGTVSQDFFFDSTGIAPFTLVKSDWEVHTFSFAAVATTTTLKFQSLTGTGWGPTVDNVSVVVSPVSVFIDIKPGSDPNSINLCSNGAVPIAILGSNTLDVRDISTETLRFAEASVRVVGKKDPHALCSYEDVNGDFVDDLICHFLTTDIAGIDGDSTTATANGELLDGTTIEGTDSVNIVKDTCN